MPVLIDGNNLLYAAYEDQPERPIARSALCERLARWQTRTGEAVTIIFDGPPPRGELAEQVAAGIEVHYSGGRKADELLAEAIAAHSAPRRLLVVSTDREVARSASRRKALALRSADFWDMLVADLAAAVAVPLEPLEKRAGLATGQADAWIAELSLEDFEPPTDVKPPGKRRRK
jgi:uncharacterized protein